MKHAISVAVAQNFVLVVRILGVIVKRQQWPAPQKPQHLRPGAARLRCRRPAQTRNDPPATRQLPSVTHASIILRVGEAPEETWSNFPLATLRPDCTEEILPRASASGAQCLAKRHGPRSCAATKRVVGRRSRLALRPRRVTRRPSFRSESNYGLAVPPGRRRPGPRRLHAGRASCRRARGATCVASRCASASRVSGRPVRVGKTRVSGVPARSTSHARRATTIVLVSGVIRCLRPFPQAIDVRSPREVQIRTAQPSELRGAQPGLDREREQGVVAATGPSGWIALYSCH